MVPDVFQVAVDERLLNIKAEGNNVPRIVHGVLQSVLEGGPVLEKGFLVVRKHEDQGYVEDVLQPFRKLEGDGMTQVQAPGTGSSPGVEEEGFAALVLVENPVEVSVAEEQTPPQPAMGLVAGHLLEAIEDFLVDDLGIPFSRKRERGEREGPLLVVSVGDKRPAKADTPWFVRSWHVPTDG